MFTYYFRPHVPKLGLPSDGKHLLSALQGRSLGHVFRIIMNDKKRWRKWTPKDKRPPDVTDERLKFNVFNNYLDGTQEVADKALMEENLKGESFLPPCIVLSAGEQMIQEQVDFLGHGRFFIKPSNGSCAQGIQVTDDLKSVVIDRNLPYVVQKEIVPKLIDGRKFDLRTYIVIAYQNNRITSYVYGKSLIRLCANAFEHDDLSSLVTNLSYQKHLPQFDMGKQYYMFKPSEKQQAEITHIATRCVEVLRDKAVGYGKEGLFFIAADIIQDTDGKMWLLEINDMPCITPQGEEIDKMFTEYLYHIMLPMRGHAPPRRSTLWKKILDDDFASDQTIEEVYTRKVRDKQEFDPMNLVG